MTMPWPYLMSRLLGLVSLVVLVTGLWFVIDWVETDLRSMFWLISGLLLLGAAIFGRRLVLLGLRRGEGAPESQPESSEVVVGSGGSRLYVESHGARGADTVVLTCGWGFDRSLWAGVVEVLKDRFRVLVWDPPGVGRSGRPFDDLYSVRRFAGDLDAVLALADGRPALVVSHGLGALAVLDLFREGRPKGIAGVVLLNAAAGSPIDAAGEAGLLHRLRKPLIEPLLKLDVWFSPLVQLAAWASYLNGTAQLAARSAAFGLDPSREAVDRAAFMASGQAPSVQARALAAALDGGRAQDAAAVFTPLLVVAGGRDALVDAEACRRTAEAAPDGDLLVLEDAGHAGPLEAPAACAAAISQHARKAFSRAAAQKAHAETLKARATSFALPPEPKSWIGAPEPESWTEDERPEPTGGGGLSAAAGRFGFN